MQDFFHQLVKAFLFFLDSGNWKLLEGYHLWMTLGMPRRTGRVEPRCVVFFWVEMMLTLFSTKKHGFNKFYGSTRGHDKLYEIHTSTNSVKIPIILGPNFSWCWKVKVEMNETGIVVILVHPFWSTIIAGWKMGGPWMMYGIYWTWGYSSLLC